MTRALLLENPHPVADSVFAAHGIEVVRHSGALDEDELIGALDGIDYLGIRSKTQVGARVLAACQGLRAIGAFCIGTNQVDLEAATRLGIGVFNAPYSNTRSVVELAIGEIIDLSRRVTVQNSRLHRGVWDKSADGAHEVRGHTLGIIGYGSIGTQLSVLAEAMGMNVIFYDSAERLALGNATQMPTMESVLREADVVSIHVDGQEANTDLIGRREFAMMKTGALFLNLSRGFIVDVDALHEALCSGHLAGEERRPLHLRPGPARQRHPHPPHRGVHRGGAVRHRALRRRQDQRLRGQRLHGHEREPAQPLTRGRPRLPQPHPTHPRQRPGSPGARQPGPRRRRGQRGRADPVDLRGDRLRPHRRVLAPGRGGTGAPGGPGLDDPPHRDAPALIARAGGDARRTGAARAGGDGRRAGAVSDVRDCARLLA